MNHLEEIPVNDKVAIYLTDGGIIGGYVLERTRDYVRLEDAFEVTEERVLGPLRAIYGKGLRLGTVEIPFLKISRWVELSAVLPGESPK